MAFIAVTVSDKRLIILGLLISC